MSCTQQSSTSKHIIRFLTNRKISKNYKAGSGTSSYITRSRYVRFQAESGNRFSATSSRVIRFRLQDSCYLDPTSVRLCFTLMSMDGAAALTPCTPLSRCVPRVRMFCGGQLCKDISCHGIVACLLDRLKPAARATGQLSHFHCRREDT